MPTNYKISIDWSGNGVWTDTGEDVTSRVLEELSITYGRDQARALSPAANGSCEFELDNHSRDYYPDNTSSPLNGLVLPARPLRIEASTRVLNSNPNFEENGAGWAAFGTSTYTRSTAYSHSGHWAARLTSDATLNPRVETTTFAVVAGDRYEYTGFVFSPVTVPTNAGVGVNWFTALGAYISTSQLSVPLTPGIWRCVSEIVTAPPTAALANLRFGFAGTPGAGVVLYADDLRITSLPLVLFRGYLDEFTLQPAIGERRVQVSGLDPLSRLGDSKATTQLYEAIRTGPAIHRVLDAINWPGDKRIIDEGASILRWWGVTGEGAWETIQDIVAAEGPPALITSDGAGNVVFKDRHHRLMTCLNPNPTFEGSTVGWSAFGGIISLDTTMFHRGGCSARFTPNGTTAITGINSDRVAVAAGTKCTATGQLRCAVARTVDLNVNWYDSSGVYISTSVNSKAIAANTWTYYLAEYTAPAGTAYAEIIPTMSGTPLNTHILHADDVRLDVGSVSVATFYDEGPEPEFSAPLTYDHGWRDVVNDVSFQVDERGPSDELEVAWSSDQVYNLGPNAVWSWTIAAEDAFWDLAQPVADVDYKVLSGFGTVTIGHTAGRTTVLTLAAGVVGVQFSGVQVRGWPVTSLRTRQVTATDAASVAAYGSKSGPDSAGSASYEDAQAVADLSVAYRKQRLPIVQMTVIGSTPARLRQCLTRNLSDRITIIDPETGLNRDFYIEQISHAITQAGLLHTTNFGCEAVPAGAGLDDPATVFRFDHPTNGKFGTGKFGR